MPKISRCSPEIPNINLPKSGKLWPWSRSKRFNVCDNARIYRGGLVVSIVFVGLGMGLVPARFCPGFAVALADDVKPNGSNAYQMVTGDDSEDDRKHWDTLFKTGAYVFGKAPAEFLRKNIALLPVGRALDIATGEGRNAVFLAKKGFKVDGVDISEVALHKAKRLARENRVSINTINADLNNYVIKPDSYDVILNIDFLSRAQVPQIKKGLRRGGVVVFENYTVDQIKNVPNKHLRKDWLLGRGELRELFKDFNILVYTETNDGKVARASLVARKP